MGRRVLITGGAGFIGSHTCLLLLEQDELRTLVGGQRWVWGLRVVYGCVAKPYSRNRADELR